MKAHTAVFMLSCLAARVAGKYLINAGSVLSKHMLLERTGKERGLIRLALIHSLLLNHSQQICCCAGENK